MFYSILQHRDRDESIQSNADEVLEAARQESDSFSFGPRHKFINTRLEIAMKEAHDHHRVTPEGRALGEQMARLVAPEIAKMAAEGEPGECCKTCAFRVGTVPNGCPQTQMDALKAVLEDVPFLCHQDMKSSDPHRLVDVCHGWFAARQNKALKGQKLECPWEFSPPDEP